ncbi:phosphatase PAP2 family protein [Sporomusa sp.]|uniref:phosphatase PAP2 family protein n=1 Tax=Sporomusa sp. TaxID=2078658 RepID=UPI002C3443E4|nr:phosphatase PAP2 family protein [Sporomusa sp.]HWR44261.1 phosphatase PAP2 family protein [Sporomusa sp.]
MPKIRLIILVLLLFLFNRPVEAHPDKYNHLIDSGLVLEVYSLDKDIQRWSQEHRNSNSDRLAKQVRGFGEIKYTSSALGIMYFTAKNNGNDKMRRTAVMGFESMLAASAITGTIKLLAHRSRPSESSSPDDWDGPSISMDHVSFPSQHASNAFAVATVIASEYHDKPGVSQIMYGLATLTALSRVNDNEHWASDVAVGSLVGYYTAKHVVNSKRKTDSSHGASILIMPVVKKF